MSISASAPGKIGSATRAGRRSLRARPGVTPTATSGWRTGPATATACPSESCYVGGGESAPSSQQAELLERLRGAIGGVLGTRGTITATSTVPRTAGVWLRPRSSHWQLPLCLALGSNSNRDCGSVSVEHAEARSCARVGPIIQDVGRQSGEGQNETGGPPRSKAFFSGKAEPKPQPGRVGDH